MQKMGTMWKEGRRGASAVFVFFQIVFRTVYYPKRMTVDILHASTQIGIRN